MTGYVRKDTTNNIADGNVINAADLDAEFDGVQDAFNASTGHNHDGTSGEGAPITALGPTQDVTISAILLAPKTNNTVDIGSSSLRYKDLFLAGNGSIGGTLAVTGVATLTAQPILSSLTASRAVFTDGSKGLVSNAITGTGNVVMSASPTLTGTIDAAAATLSGNLTLSGGTANGVTYLNGSKVVTSGSALTFDGTTQTVTYASNGIGYRAKGSASGTNIDAATSRGGTIGLFNLDATNGNTSAVEFYNSNELTSSFISGVNTSHSGRTGQIAFGVANGSAPTEQMRLTSTGLGIGTSSPAYKLDVRGSSGNIASWSDGTTTGTLYAGGGYVGLTFPAATGGFFVNPSGNFNTISTNGVERMRIDSSGNLGLGVTPSAWGSGYKGLQVNSGLTLMGSSINGNVTANAYFDGTYWRFISNGYATTYYANYANNGSHVWGVTSSGTAGLGINGTSGVWTTAMTLDASGNLGVGVTDPATYGGVFVARSTSGANFSVRTLSGIGGSGTGVGLDALGNGASSVVDIGIRGNTIQFRNSGSEAARIDSSGNLLVGTTSTSNGALINWYKASGTIETSLGGITTAQNHIVFANPNGNVGSIQVDGSATSYNTSSDYRLKNTIAPMTGALAKVALLKPCTYKWNVDGSEGEGFIAHELAEVVPQCVTGEKDAVDEDGNPKYQGIDTSFLVATLTAALQELNAKFDAYVASHP